jgi:hypothetical protein
MQSPCDALAAQPPRAFPLSPSARLAFHVPIVSLLLGLLADGLLRVGPWGLNAALWIIAFVAGTAAIVQLNGLPLDRRAVRWIPPILLGAAALAWRDSPALKFLTLLALATLVVLASWHARGAPVTVGAFSDRLARLGLMGFRTGLGLLPVLTAEWGWRGDTRDSWTRRTLSTGIGLLLAIPLLLVFGSLFASADHVFDSLIRSVFQFDLAEGISHVILTLVCAWLVGGYLTGVICREGRTESIPRLPQFVTLGSIEVGVALGLLNLLFLVFIVVQIRYLFGGAELVQVTSNLTYAEYARHGFFQMAASAALALLVLWTVDWLLGSNSKRAFRAQALALIAMVGVVLASAFYRMRLYQAEYGWTELRYYVMAFMGWLTVVLVWFALTVLRDERDRFLFGAALAGLLGIAALLALNPDAWIARQNLERMREGRQFDAAYLTELSADAAPVLAAALPELSPEDRGVLEKRLQRWAPADSDDWRAWSWSRARAREAVSAVTGAPLQPTPPPR